MPTGSNASTWTSDKVDHAQWFRSCQDDDSCKPFFEPFQQYLPNAGQNCTISDVIHASVDIRLDLDTGEPLPSQGYGLFPTFEHWRQTKCSSGLITHQGACVWHNDSMVVLPVWYNATNATNATGTYIGSLLVNRTSTEVCTSNGYTASSEVTWEDAYAPPSPPPGGGARRSQLLTACLLDPSRLPIECTQRDALFAFFDRNSLVRRSGPTAGKAWHG